MKCNEAFYNEFRSVNGEWLATKVAFDWFVFVCVCAGLSLNQNVNMYSSGPKK